MAASSGFLRTLKFVRYLPDYNWLPTVLTVHPRAYNQINNAMINQIPDEVRVLRSFCLDASRHLSIAGRYPSWIALPDRWNSWILSGVPAGLKTIRKGRISVIFSTFPIVTAVVIGSILKKITKLPWVVDFRDSMTEPHYPRDARTRRIWQRIERQAISNADRFLFTAPSTREMYLKRYPQLREADCIVIPNGYDEDDFKNLNYSSTGKTTNRPIRLLHLGLLYPKERDPRVFFDALSDLKKEGGISASRIQIDLRASGSEDYYEKLLQEKKINDIVNLLPSLPYPEALSEATKCDALMIFQDESCNHQIPAKAYEYLRLQKPIIALTSHLGDTAQLLKRAHGACIIDLKNHEEIVSKLPIFLSSVESRSYAIADPGFFTQFERRNLTSKLSQCLDALVNPLRA